METTGRKQCAATAENMLAMFRLRDVSFHVVLQDGWEMLNLEPNTDGSIIWYYDADFCYQFHKLCDEDQIRVERCPKCYFQQDT
jgi:hypothetical protein